MSSRVALRGSYRQHSSRSIRIGRPHPYERLEVTLVLRRRRPAPHPWAGASYHSHDDLSDLYGAEPEDVEVVEAFASVRHLNVTNIDL